MPTYTVVSAFENQNTAISLTDEASINYFKNVLGRSYNYTELIALVNQNLTFTYGNIERNTDPIKIYEYGKGRCEEFATLYAELCISQGYRCRIVHNVFNDHVFNEVLESNGTWIRVDSSLTENDSRAVGYPMFFENEKGWTAPILSLAFENSTITEVTSTYRSDGFDLLSSTAIAVLTILFAYVVFPVYRELIRSPPKSEIEEDSDDKKVKIGPDEEKERDKLIYEVIVDRHNQELKRTSDLDSKANNTIGFAGLLATLIATVIGFLPKGSYTLLFAVPLALLLGSAILGLLAYRVRTYETIDPMVFVEYYKTTTYQKTLRNYIHQTAETTLKNHKVHENKAKLIKYASELLVLAIVLFLIIVIFNWIV